MGPECALKCCPLITWDKWRLVGNVFTKWSIHGSYVQLPTWHTWQDNFFLGNVCMRCRLLSLYHGENTQTEVACKNLRSYLLSTQTWIPTEKNNSSSQSCKHKNAQEFPVNCPSWTLSSSVTKSKAKFICQVTHKENRWIKKLKWRPYFKARIRESTRKEKLKFKI